MTTERQPFPVYVIAEPCVGVMDASCVEVCPVDCIQTAPEADQYFVDPALCIACDQCVLVCPVDALYLEDEVPAEWVDSIRKNEEFFQRSRSAGIGPDRAGRMIDAAVGVAEEFGIDVAIAIVDRCGSIVSHHMDGASAEQSGRAARVAYTAAMFQLATAKLSEHSRMPEERVVDRARLLFEPGGYPIPDGAYNVGGLGISGASVELVEACARVALDSR